LTAPTREEGLGRRGYLSIIAAVLEACHPAPARTSRVMHRANLRGWRWKRYRNYLTSRGLLEPSLNGLDLHYATTEKGREYLDHYHALERLLQEPEEAQEREGR